MNIVRSVRQIICQNRLFEQNDCLTPNIQIYDNNANADNANDYNADNNANNNGNDDNSNANNNYNVNNINTKENDNDANNKDNDNDNFHKQKT